MAQTIVVGTGAVCLVMLTACGGEGAARDRPSTPGAPTATSVRAPQGPRAAPPRETTRMDLDAIDQVVRQVAPDAQRRGGVWELSLGGVPMAIITDTRADRMRIVATITEEAQMTPEQRSAVMEANFHTALDARYATSRGVLYAAFIHPLSPLTKDELRSALQQVAALARSFGTSYTSGNLIFGGGP